MHVELIAITRYMRGDGTPEELIEHAGRVCYHSEARSDTEAFVQRRLREGHESIIEHATATFEISGISRSCSHQLVRHRLASYSQESQRYVDASNAEFVVPESVSADPEARAIWDKCTTQAGDAYRALRQRGIRKEDCRFLLPNATATRMVMTMNFRELRHLIKLRGLNPAAQWEIRQLANRILDLVYEQAPSVFQDLVDARTPQP
ncbi:MAG: FAD-dependent thymidylate synthase [Chloroflexota bacterium]|nr:FAD-dependent thymidylate synthase [Chloroflexota bacterium]